MNEFEVKQTDTIKPSGRQLPKPYLLTRMGAALFDLLIAIIIFGGLQAGVFYGLYGPLGYHQALASAQEVLSDSGLYVYDAQRGYLTITETYDDTLTPSENYDNPITTYYSNDARAIAENKLDSYYVAKIASGLFELNDEQIPELLPDVSETALKSFYGAEYGKAVVFLEQDPVYVAGIRQTFLIALFSNLVTITLSCSIVYLLVPMLRPNGQTPMQILLKIGLADASSDTRVKRGQIAIRFAILLLFNVWLPILLYARFAYFTLVPIFVTLILMTITKASRGPHDFASNTYIVSLKDMQIPQRKQQEITNSAEGFR
ncbi:MAG TPA: RDD family protein [Bacilli bacterium]|nr:RDD family protein [Bacilli bacterium]